VAAVGLGGGEIITSMMFVADDALSGSKGTSLDKGNVAITFTADGAAGVGGLIQPGDSINIMSRVSDREEAVGLSTQLDAPTGTEWMLNSPYVYSFQDVKVLAVGTNLGEPVAAADGAAPAEGAPPPPATSSLITVQLPPDKAIVLASVKDSELWLTLNRPDYEPTPQPFQYVLPEFWGQQGVSPYPEQPAGTEGQ
jgi:Flp pilus assembly protein CpaB